MAHRVALGALAALTVFALLGCGGSRGTNSRGGHTYVLAPLASQHVLPFNGLYFTIVSRVALPSSVLKASHARLVSKSKGPTDCSYTKPFQGLAGTAAYLNGKTVSLTVNGSNPVTAVICSALKNGRTFRPTVLSGS
jgi:hypothetical protein